MNGKIPETFRKQETEKYYDTEKYSSLATKLVSMHKMDGFERKLYYI